MPPTQSAPTGPERKKRKWLALLLALLGLLVLAVVLLLAGPVRSLASGAVSRPPQSVTHSAPAAPVEAPAQAPDGIPAGAVPATVVAIVDGDTIDTDLGRVRIHGINTPEVGQPYSAEATDLVAATIPVGTQVWLYQSPGSDDVDRYDRLIRTVYTAEGQDLGQTLVQDGLAEAYLDYSTVYATDQTLAQGSGLGMWEVAEADWSPQAQAPWGSGDAPDGSASTEDGTASSDLSSEPWNQPGPDIDCANIIGGPVQVLPPDYHDLDRDGDGWACES